MPRKPNYDFERRERERLKQEKNAARAEEKRKTTETPATTETPDAPEDSE